jgi:hypothetical protein
MAWLKATARLHLRSPHHCAGLIADGDAQQLLLVLLSSRGSDWSRLRVELKSQVNQKERRGLTGLYQRMNPVAKEPPTRKSPGGCSRAAFVHQVRLLCTYEEAFVAVRRACFAGYAQARA